MAKNANGEGTVHARQDRSGKIVGYRGQYYVDTPSGRKRRSINASTKTEARRLLREKQNESQGIVEWDTSTLTVAEYLRQWLTDAKSSLAPRAYANYRLHVEQHIIPALGSTKLDKLSSRQVQAFYNRESETYAPSTVRYVHAILHRALKQAQMRWRIIPRNPSDDPELPTVSHKQTDTLTLAQAEKLLATVDESKDRLAALYYVALFGGLRIGEALALKWRYVDFDRQELHVRAQVQRLRDGNGLTETIPKRDEQRTIPVGDRVVTALRVHRASQNEERLAMGGKYDDHDLVFATRKGTHMDASNVVSRSLKPLLKKAGLSQIRFHDQRHTFATLLTSRGVDAVTIQEMMGHKDVATTLKFYGHSSPEGKRHAASVFDATGSPGRSRPG